MKYLKSFNERSKFSSELIINQDDIDNIMDIFRDIIDEYDLITIDGRAESILDNNTAYRLFTIQDDITFLLQINVTELASNEKFKSDIEDFKKRLDLDVFFTEVEYIESTYYGAPIIILEIDISKIAEN